MDKSRLYLIDATAFCYRAFYALPGLSTSLGQPTNAIYGFTSMLKKILREKEAEFMAACFDVSRDTFRKEKFRDYKIQRPPMPDSLASQMPFIKEIVAAYGIAIFEKKGYEADDIIATLARRAKDNGMPTTIISADKDMLQLVDDGILVYNPHKEEGILYGRGEVEELFGIEPQQVTDLIALMGDSVDNIPGIAGIGRKTAVELIKTFGSLAGLLDNLDTLRQDKIKKAIRDNVDMIKLNKEIATLDSGMDLDFNVNALRVKQPDYKELSRLFRCLEFKALLNDLPFTDEPQAEAEVLKFKDAQLEGILKGEDELVMSGTNPDDLSFYIYTGNISFRVIESGQVMRGILSNPRIKKVGHDLKKIKVSLAKQGITLEGLYFDTLIAGYLINPAKSSYNLPDLAWDYLDKLTVPNIINRQMEVSLIRGLRPKLKEALCDKSLWGLFAELEMPLVNVLAQMELAGIRLDLEVLNCLSKELEERLVKLIEDIYRISGCQFNINSPKQLRDVLFSRLKLPIIKKTKTGPSTDEEVLRKLAGKHKLPEFLLEYRQLAKLKSTYIDTLPGLTDPHTGRVHTSFNQTATETGRLSSSQPNLQNLPIKTDLGKSIRRAVIAFTEDSCLVSCDYSQIELRILAHLSKDENLICAFRKNQDIHKSTASLIYGLEENDITEALREKGKRVNFGITYGLTFFGLSRDLGITHEQAQAFIDAYFLRYPRVRGYIENQIAQAKKQGFVTTILGRRRYIPEINNKNQNIRQVAERQAVNAPIQGSASDLIKLAMVQIHEQIIKQDLKAKMILQIHDELVFDVPEDGFSEFVILARERMENALRLDVPLMVSIKRGKNWLDMEGII